MTSENIVWKLVTFEQLTTTELYLLLQLRVEVFVVEQSCFYQDLDGKDREAQTLHLLAYLGSELVAYARLLAPGVSYVDFASIGRVIVAPQARGHQLGNRLMARAVAACEKYWPQRAIKISAQQHLQSFYRRHQFNTVSEPYLEDDIPHVAMLRRCAT